MATVSRQRRYHIALPPSYDERLRDRMRARGVGRSEAIRQLIDEAESNFGRQRRLAKGPIGALRTDTAWLRSTMHLPEVERVLQRMTRHLDDLAATMDLA